MPEAAGRRLFGWLKQWWLHSYIPVAVLVLGVLSLGMLAWTNQLSERQLLQSNYAQALQDLRIRVSTAHLWVEEAITFSTDEIDMAWAEFGQARSLADALVNGGDTEHGGSIPPLQDARLRKLAIEIRKLLDQFAANVEERWRTLAKVGSPLDKRTNEIFASIQSRSAELERILKEREARDHAKARRVYTGVVAAWALIVATLTGQLVRHERTRRRAEKKLEQANGELKRLVAERTTAVRGLHLELDERKKTEAALRESEARAHELSVRLLTAQETERKRISTELHDELGHALAYLKLRIGLLQEELRADQATARAECAKLTAFVDQTIENVRRLSRDLSPSILEDLGLSASLHWLVDTCVGNHETQVVSDDSDLDRLLAPNAQILVYRIVQEALTNVKKHARATRVRLAIEAQADRLTFAVSDDGAGFHMERAPVQPGPPNGKGLGMTTMRERAQMLGGTFQVCSVEGGGTHVLLAVPVQEWRSP